MIESLRTAKRDHPEDGAADLSTLARTHPDMGSVRIERSLGGTRTANPGVRNLFGLGPPNGPPPHRRPQLFPRGGAHRRQSQTTQAQHRPVRGPIQCPNHSVGAARRERLLHRSTLRRWSQSTSSLEVSRRLPLVRDALPTVWGLHTLARAVRHALRFEPRRGDARPPSRAPPVTRLKPGSHEPSAPSCHWHCTPTRSYTDRGLTRKNNKPILWKLGRPHRNSCGLFFKP